MGFSESRKDPAIRFVVDDSLFAELIQAGAVELVGADEKLLRVPLVASELLKARECIDRHTVPMLDASAAFHRDPKSVLRLSPDQEPTVRAKSTSMVYPPAAVAEGREGTTVTRLTIGTNGRVTGCEIARSSGWSDLDAAACAGLRGWIFHPATDGDAVPVPVPVHQPVIWQLDRFRE
jgi:TonB family protein